MLKVVHKDRTRNGKGELELVTVYKDTDPRWSDIPYMVVFTRPRYVIDKEHLTALEVNQALLRRGFKVVRTEDLA